jgi:Xaa-Pro aminopeptidase
LVSNALDGFLVTSLENVRYFSGFTGSDAVLILTRNQNYFLTDSRYVTQSQKETSGHQIVEYKKKMRGIIDLVQACRIKRLGFESQHLAYGQYTELSKELPNTHLVPLDGEIRTARIKKDPSEIILLRRAIDIAEQALTLNLHRIRQGATEVEMAWEMEFEMRRQGADSIGFDTIVASGERGALPHGKASDKKFEKGDLIVIDFGARYRGYHSDQTCTVVLEDPTSEQREIYSIVKEAHDRAIQKVRPGVTLKDIDAVARDYIDKKGYGSRFGHGLGHGVGLAVHEEPRVSFDTEGIAEAGMVFTIEPGIYIPGWGGIRIEDMVLVTPGGGEVLTRIGKDLKVLK